MLCQLVERCVSSPTPTELRGQNVLQLVYYFRFNRRRCTILGAAIGLASVKALLRIVYVCRCRRPDTRIRQTELSLCVSCFGR